MISKRIDNLIRDVTNDKIDKKTILRELYELKTIYTTTMKRFESGLELNDLLPTETFMPSDELVLHCRAYSDRKYLSA